jgi:hypothetical protein
MWWYALGIIAYSLFRLQANNGIEHVVRSDGDGYYAYLPALLLYQDPHFEASAKAEQTDPAWNPSSLYLSLDEHGNPHNKYFPGVAILQTPFFLVGHGFAWASGDETNGYTYWYKWWFYIGSLCYTLLGIYFFRRLLYRLYPERFPRFEWVIAALFVCTPLLHYLTETPSFGHLYSFFLIALFGNLVLSLHAEPGCKKYALWLGLVFGLILLVRPTNGVVLFIIPALLGSWAQTKTFVLQFFSKGMMFLTLFVGCMAVLGIQLAIWKWETGQWIVWAYSGEGFNFLSPRIMEVLFSYRIGLFLHHPLAILVLIAALWWVKQKGFPAIFWLLYATVNLWIIAAWWCWDYESPFGVRPLTEHLPFVVLPLFAAGLEWKMSSYLLIACALLGVLRTGQYVGGTYTTQRFTATSYWESLLFWKDENRGRWSYSLSCPPHGKCLKSELLLDEAPEKRILPGEEFHYTVHFKPDSLRTHERYYYVVEFDKRRDYHNFQNVYFVIDAVDKESEMRYYKTVEMFNDRLEGRDEWVHLRLDGIIHDNLRAYDEVTMYVWNRNGEPFLLRNVKISVETYKN